MIEKDNTEAIGHNAHLAGLIDGDGCIYAARRIRKQPKRDGSGSYPNRMYFLTVELTMCCETTIRTVQKRFGGNVCVQKSRTGRPYFHLRIYNENAITVLKKIFPYLVTKKRQAALAMKYREVIKQGRWSRDSHRYELLDSLIEEIRQCNQRWTNKRTLTKAVETVRDDSELTSGYDPVRPSEQSEEVLQATA